MYNGGEPFASFLKKYFAVHKKYGSRDRKQISHLCYSFFRTGNMCSEAETGDRLLAALFLCSNEPQEILQQLRPEWNQQITLPPDEKLKISMPGCRPEDIFPFDEELSAAIVKNVFILSHLIQPDFFLRLRPQREETVKNKLVDAGIAFVPVTANCLALPNASKTDKVIALNREAVVQDYSSQQIATFFPPVLNEGRVPVWDCCAASGGKSILLHDLFPGVDLTVSDIRDSIIINLRKRFKEAGIAQYKSFVADLSSGTGRNAMPAFRFIMADVPCSGSGTWGRTPEQLVYFKKEKIDEYASLQKRIVSTVIPQLLPGGYLLYITCSVFKKENEDAVDFIQNRFHLRLEKMGTLAGFDKKADTMFAALFKLPH